VGPTVRSFSAAFDPLALVERFPEQFPGLLESGVESTASSGARFDILPLASGEVLRLSGRELSGPHAQTGGFLSALEAWWQELKTATISTNPELPFSGGWLVYLGYELAAEIEPRLKLPVSDDPIAALAIRTPAAWVRDRRSGEAYVVAEPGHEALLEQLSARLADLPIARQTELGPFEITEEPAQRFTDAVRTALEYTSAGDVYQTNLSRQWQASAAQPINPVALYRRLRAANPSPFAALLRFADMGLLSSSPERLLSIRQGRISTRPIAGTRPRGSTSADDAILIRSLLENEKERAEHVMLIDLERNDLGKVCRGGSVQVDEYMSVETYAHVHHIVSNVSGEMRADASPIAALRALFPGGTITGCPKFRCMQIIAELEGCGRGAYTGSLGYLNRDGSCDFNILIRTITTHARQLKFRAGAGIVADSNAAQELAETRAKAEGMLRALDARR
jgi:anthranilate synthase component I